MRMEPMDQFFRKKIEERQYEYHEAYWEEAERLITQREGRRRRAFWWWCFGFALLCVGIEGAGWWYGPTGSDEKTTIGPAPVSDPGGAEISPKVSLELIPEKQPEKQPGINGRQGVVPPLETDGTVGPGSGKSAGQVAFTQRKDGNMAKEGVLDIDKGFKDESFIRKSSIGEPTENRKERVVPTNSPLIDSAAIVKNRPLALAKSKNFSVDWLSTLLGPVDERPATLEMNPLVRHYLIRPRKMINWELALGATVNPFDGKSLLGGVASLRASYRVRENTLLTLGAQYRLRGGSFGPSQESRQVRYAFGREAQKYSLQPNRLHYAEALLQVEWPVKRHCLALGLGWNYLVGVEGSLSRTEKGAFAIRFDAESRLEKGWLDEEGYKKHFGVGRASYYYQLPGGLKIGLELQYTPGKIVEKGAEGQPGIPLLKESNPLMIDVGVKYRL